MDLASTIAYYIGAFISGAVGILTSGFMVAFNLLDWVRSRRLNTCDFIMLILGISCTCYQFTLIGHAYVTMKSQVLFKLNYPLPVLEGLQIWMFSCSFWNTSCLCVFYCVKIVDLNHRLFFKLKARITKVVPWFLAGSVAGSFMLSIPMYCEYDERSSEILTTNITTNVTVTLLNKSWYLSVVIVLGFCLPVLIDIASITLILTSLFRHTRRMKDNASGFSQPRLQAHFGAVQIVGSLLCVFIVFLLAQCYLLHSTGHWFDLIADISRYCAPAEISTILLVGNTRLRQGLWKFFKLWRR
ncbi:taste receptor type 2 member 9-like [Lissotriton helveticus]